MSAPSLIEFPRGGPRSIVIRNSTPVPNWFLDEILRMRGLPPSAIRVLLYLWRKTVGWDKEADFVSLSQIESGCAIGRREAVAGAKLWASVGLFSARLGDMPRSMTEYTVNVEADPRTVLAELELRCIERRAKKKRERLKRLSTQNGDW